MSTARIWSVRLAAFAILVTTTSAAAGPATICDNEAADGPSADVPGVAAVGLHIGPPEDTWVSVDLPGEDLDMLVGVDLENLEGKSAVCVRAPGAGNRHVNVLTRRGPLGATVWVELCDPLCTPLLGQTGVELAPTAPLFSCVWVNGFQQNPGCPG